MRTFIVCTILVFSWDTFWDLLKNNPTVLSGLLGILIGGTITLYITGRFYKKKRKDDVSFKLVDQYFEKFNEIETVQGLLSLNKIYNKDEKNQIVKLGNWYNFAKGLENTKMINDEILGNMSLGYEIDAFIIKIEEKTNKQNRQTTDFKEMKKSWDFLFNNKDKSSWKNHFNIFNRKVKVLVGSSNERKEQIEPKN